ncbi:MAG: PKD domain-containing protein [Armatimonadota bacterium]
MNPTGDPIGGGPGYRSIADPDGATAVVRTPQGLLEALQAATAGDVVYVDDSAEVDMTGIEMVEVPGGVTLASGRGRDGSRGGLIYSDSRYPNGEYTAVLLTGGPAVRLTGLRLRGPSGDYGDHHYERIGVSCAVRDAHGDLQVDNCELWCWDKWAIYLDEIGRAHIHHNFIHHTRRAGYGYGVWVADGGEALIEANLFDFNRHHIGSGAQETGSYEARYNLCLWHDTNPSFDRHGGSGRAGGWTRIHHNTFRNSQVEAILLRGIPAGGAEFHHNWFYHHTREAAIDDRRAHATREKVHDNHYGPVDESELPLAVAEASPAGGTAPLTVRFDGTRSQSPDGGPVLYHEWNFGDQPGPVGVRAWGPVVSHTFARAGLYPVELRVADERGITAETWEPVLVEPDAPGAWLSACLKDSNKSDVPGYYRKQILIDGEVIWEDDSAGDERWEHVLLELTPLVAGRDECGLAFRLLCDRQVQDPASELHEIFYYIDDVHIFGGDVRDGGFEGRRGWTYSETPEGTRFTGLRWCGEARSGRSCYTLEVPYAGTVPAGSYCQVAQRASLGSKPDDGGASR